MGGERGSGEVIVPLSSGARIGCPAAAAIKVTDCLPGCDWQARSLAFALKGKVKQRRGCGGAAQALGKPPSGGEANIMAVAPPAARFPYLPISMPAGAGARGARAHAADAKLALGVRGARGRA